ncbi:hypothetical protein AXK11_00810 [Cephaloticoccus primus]|uniref:Ribonuclease VapC n=1 Tax=Cephaloticoccus primus TaxID=1548207 RepID=A0A139SUL3_9BACT|nr:type II toxin-antitoxin system VapC family toxin [Cephaloticoccus primus]KXU38224.1 hypothetical protein AXK11_00810 [Cephaloticoccus primus]
MIARIYLPDTNLISQFLLGRDVRLCERVEKYAEQLYLSAIVWSELRYGVEKSGNLPRLVIRLAKLREKFPEVEAFDEHAAWWAANVRAYLANLKPNAQPIGYADCLLAGHALALGATIITHNTREFSRVPHLEVEDWQLA